MSIFIRNSALKITVVLIAAICLATFFVLDFESHVKAPESALLSAPAVIEPSNPEPVVVQSQAKLLAEYADRKVPLESKVDKSNSIEYNLALDQRRADSQKKTLELDGAKTGQLNNIGYGEEKPKDAGSNKVPLPQSTPTVVSTAKGAAPLPENSIKPSTGKPIMEHTEIAVGTEVPWVVNKPPKIYAESKVPIEVVLQPGRTQEFLSKTLKNDVGNKFVGGVIAGGAEYTKRMRASLTGDKDEFEIISLPEKSDGWQKVELDRPTRWMWNVTPKKTGKLMLYVTIESDFGDGVRNSLPKPHEIEVEVSWVYVTHIGWRFIKENYDVLAGIFAALGAMLTWILKHRKRTQAASRKAEHIAVPPHE